MSFLTDFLQKGHICTLEMSSKEKRELEGAVVNIFWIWSRHIYCQPYLQMQNGMQKIGGKYEEKRCIDLCNDL